MTPPQPRQRIPVTVLGATGVVGQRFVRRLANHPWFRVDHLAASERSAGQRYGEACAWRLGGEPHGGLADLEVRACDPSAAPAPIVFSALDSGPAKEIEPAYARAGSLVFSNASAFRMAADVPLLVPEVNADHLDLVDVQREARDWSGAIVTNPNCTSTVLVMALAPLHRAFGVEKVFVATMQATSGAGYPGVPSLDILSNVVPHISGEEEKVETETQKMLGTLQMGRIVPAAATVSAMCHRVPVIDGHTEAVSVQLRGNPAPEEVAEALRTWSSVPQEMQLPSAP
ncbi:MAG: aspartate-semialdehyde dehydrogenase, partial [Planctomycetota bacterium]